MAEIPTPSETTPGPTPGDEQPKMDAHGCTIGVTVWNGSECVPIQGEPTQSAEQGAEKSLTERVADMVKEYVEVAIKDIQASVDKKFAEIEKTIQGRINTELEEGVRKGLGIPKDPYVKASEIEAHIRKAILSGSKDTKGLLQKTTASSPDGVGPKDESPISKIFREAKL